MNALAPSRIARPRREPHDAQSNTVALDYHAGLEQWATPLFEPGRGDQCHVPLGEGCLEALRLEGQQVGRSWAEYVESHHRAKLDHEPSAVAGVASSAGSVALDQHVARIQMEHGAPLRPQLVQQALAAFESSHWKRRAAAWIDLAADLSHQCQGEVVGGALRTRGRELGHDLWRERREDPVGRWGGRASVASRDRKQRSEPVTDPQAILLA